MDIRKSDSKGRLTGFKKGEYYTLKRIYNGSILFEPLDLDYDVDIPLPANKNTQDYLESLGLDIRVMSADGVSRLGWNRIVKGSPDKIREPWPDGFDFDVFLLKAWGG